MHPFYERIIGNDLCPFCKEMMKINMWGKVELQEITTTDFKCPNGCFHRVLGTDHNSNGVLEIGFNIYFDSNILSIDEYNLQGGEYWYQDNYLLIWRAYPEVHIEIPIFDCFSYSLKDLEAKIKGYLVFQ